jgi:hypothetical protein
MKLEIVIDIFSGRSNPVLELENDEATQTLERLKPSRKLGKDDLGPSPDSNLGYRGLKFIQKGNKSKSRDLPNRFRLVNGDLFDLGLPTVPLMKTMKISSVAQKDLFER